MRNLLALVLILAAAAGYAQPAKGKLIIIGGGDRPEVIIKRIIKESGLDQGGYGIVLPMSSATPDSSVYYAREPFRKQGVLTLYGMNFIKGDAVAKERVDSIRQAKLIYITGGDQNRFMDVVRGTEIEQAIREAYRRGSVVSGTSAGAAVMSRRMITGNELKHKGYESTFRTIEEKNLEIYEGLGLIDQVIVDQHFIIRSRYNRLITAVIEYPDCVGIGIDESTAIVVSGKEVEVIGESQVILLSGRKAPRSAIGGKLAARNLSLSLYLPGEKFRVDQ